MNYRLLFTTALAALILSSPAVSQAPAPGAEALPSPALNDPDKAASGAAAASGPRAPAAPSAAQQAHKDQDQAIVVTGVRRRAQDVLGGLSVLDEAGLNRALRPSIGDTLAQLPGVSATSFGPVASKPVLRGLSGDRVRILTDGIGSLDLSASGPDHAVSINPITAQRIEVLRGPPVLSGWR